MSKTFDIAICSATSLAAETLIRLLEEKSFPIGHFYPLSDSADSGSVVEFREEERDVLTESGFEFTDVDLVFIPAGVQVADNTVLFAIEAGCMVIDGSSGAAEQYNSIVYVHESEEMSLEDAVAQKRLVIPSSPAAALMPVLQAIQEKLGVERIDLTACQSVSAQGTPGVDELRKQTVQLLNGKPVENAVFPHRVAYNLIPEVGMIDGTGVSATEYAVEAEIRSVLDVDDIDVRSTCITVPVFFGDSLAVSLDTSAPVDLDSIASDLSSIGQVSVFSRGDSPTVEQAAGADEILLGRIRKIPGRDHSLSFWLTADNTRLGAQASVTAAERLVKDFLK